MSKVYFGRNLKIESKKSGQRSSKAIEIAQTATKSGDVKAAVDEEKKTQAWGAKLGPLFKFMTWLNRYKIYRPYYHIPYETVYGWGHLIGKAGLGASGSVIRKVRNSIKAFYPEKSRGWVAKMATASLKYQGGLLLDFMFNLPLTSDIHAPYPYDHFFRFTNPEVLDNLLKGGKGALICVTHIGAFLSTMPGFTLNPHNWNLASVANLTNSTFYQNLICKPAWKRLYVYPSISFKYIGKFLERHLKNNFGLIMFQDYSMPGQMRVPLMPGKYPYLVHSVQSTINLHRKTQAPIVVCIAHPDKGMIGRTRFEFIDNTAIMEASKKYWNAPNEKEFYGQVSVEINKQIYKYIRVYAHCWEEIQNFAYMRLADKLKLPAGLTLSQFTDQIQAKMLGILEGSWEPNRDDKAIAALVSKQLSSIKAALSQPETVLRPHKTKIDLSQMDGVSELQKLTSVMAKELKIKNEPKAAEICDRLKYELEASRPAKPSA